MKRVTKCLPPFSRCFAGQCKAFFENVPLVSNASTGEADFSSWAMSGFGSVVDGP